MVYNELEGSSGTIVDPLDSTRQRQMNESGRFEDLLQPLLVDGQAVLPARPLDELREHAASQLAMFHNGVLRLKNPHRYPVGLEKNLFQLKEKLVLEARG